MTPHRQWLRGMMPLGVVWAFALGANAQTVPAPSPAPTVPAPSPVPPPAPPTVPAAPTLPTDTDRAGIAAAYDALNAAYVKGDLKTYFALFAPDYQVTGTDGKEQDLSQVEKQTRQQRGEVTSFHSHWTLGPLTPTALPEGGNGQAVVLATHSSGTGQKRVLFFTAKGSFVDDTQMRDFWVNTPQGWRLSRRQVLTEHLQSHPE